MDDSGSHNSASRLDPLLRTFASVGAPSETRSVVVEVNAEPVRLLRPPLGESLARRALGVDVQAAARRQSSSSANLERLTKRLAALGLLEAAHVIPAALAVVVDVSAQQLRELMDADEVAVIRPNRKLSPKAAASG